MRVWWRKWFGLECGGAGDADRAAWQGRALTVGKYPKVNTLNKLVLPQAPSPIMTSFL